MLKIRFIGNVKIEKDSQDLTQSLPGKAIALLCLLFMSEKQSMNRAKVIEYLWPDSREDAGKSNLRFNLWEIKNVIGQDKDGNSLLLANRQICSINPRFDYVCDFSLIRNLDKDKENSIDDWIRAKELFVGEFMEGYYFKECEELNDMILFERRGLEDQRIRVLFHLLDHYTYYGENEATFEILRELERVGPYDEVVAKKIIENYEKMGRRSSGILFYQHFRSRLSTYFGIQPSEDLKSTYESLKTREKMFLSEGERLPEKPTMDPEKEGGPREENIKGHVLIETSCIGDIKYYWISDLLEKMEKEKSLSYEVRAVRDRKKDLDILDIDKDFSGVERPPDMRLAKSFLYLMEEIISKFDLEIVIHRSNRMDSFSRMILDQMKESMDLKVKEE